MILYKFVRTESYDLCLAEFLVSNSAKINEHSYDVVDVSSITLLHTYLLIGNEWVEKQIDTVYSIIELNGSAEFKKGISTTSNLTRGFYAFTTKEAQHFTCYKEHFTYQLDLLKEKNN